MAESYSYHFTPVDYVIIQKQYKKLFSKVEESGIVSYDTIINKFGDYFQEFEYEVPKLKLISKENSDKIERQFNSLRLIKPAVDFGISVGFDGFANVRP